MQVGDEISQGVTGLAVAATLLRPSTDNTIPERLDGICAGVVFTNPRAPFCRNQESLVLKADETCAAVPVAVTNKLFGATEMPVKPALVRKLLTLSTDDALGA